MNQTGELSVYDSMKTTPNPTAALPLEFGPPDARVFLNARVWLVDDDGLRVIYGRHEPLFRIPLGDAVSLRLAAVTLRQSKLASQEEVAQAFGHSVATQRRWETRYEQASLSGLAPKRRPGMRPKVAGTQEALVRRWFAAGATNTALARRLAVDEATIRRTLRRLGLQRVARRPAVLPFAVEAEALAKEPVPQVEAPAKGPVPQAEAFAPAAELHPEEPLVPAPEGGAEEEVSRFAEQGSEALESELANVVAEPPSSVSEMDLATVLAAAASDTIDRDPRDRSGDRALARLGMLDDALPLFGDIQNLPRAGVLLVIPLLARHGLVDVFQQVYRNLGPAFYGLRTMVVTMFLYALLRIKRVEHVKEYSPEALGQLVGLDRGPEVKTIRRKFSELAAAKRAAELQAALARRRIAADEERLAFLYVDGHLREYRGKYRLPPGKKPQRQVVTPAATDTWVHDARGEPLLVVTHEVNAQLTQVLEPILSDVRKLIPQDQRVTVAFDRGGFSPKLFAQLHAQKYDVLTYRKGRKRPLPRSRFTVQGQQIEGVWREYEICDRPRVPVGKRPTGDSSKDGGKYFWMREVRVWRADGRQTSILTHRLDLSAVEVAYRMFNRWCQENYFKYMDAEFELDALVEYGADPVSPEVDRPNPRRKPVEKRLKKARDEVRRLQAELGEQLSGSPPKQRTVRGFKIAHVALRRRLAAAEARVERLEQQRRQLPERVPATEWQKLKTEKKLIVDAIKIAAYQVETELFGMLAGHYARTEEEGRTLLHAAFQSAADLKVSDGELRVTIAAQSSPHRTAALAALCAQLDALSARFPGTSLRLRLAVAPHPTAHFNETACQEL